MGVLLAGLVVTGVAAEENWAAVRERLAPHVASLPPNDVVLLARAYRELGDVTRSADVLAAGVERFPLNRTVALAWIDEALDSGIFATALTRAEESASRIGAWPELHLRLAKAYFGLGEYLGASQVRTLPDARPGQFIGPTLVVERRGETDRYLCCGPKSALFHVRRALDTGLDDPFAHWLHARIWLEIDRPKRAAAVLEGRLPVLIEWDALRTYRALAETQLRLGELDEYLRTNRRLASARPETADNVMFTAYTTLAERYNQRGDDALYCAFLRHAAKLRPEDADLVLRLADAYWDAGHFEDAGPSYRRVLELNEAHPQRLRILERLAR